ncbi:MAG TPA: Gfo/Idh/MocA family oxidoreductase [Anaerolineae bacterium]|nr:Gfo/Idh/MocA family oxidoreductase [Anaerolineae bacterium]
MSPRKFHIGLIGFGFIGKVHANAYRSIPYAFKQPVVTASLQAVLRSKKQPEEQFLSDIETKCCFSKEEFYNQPLDIIDICTPNFLHREQAIEALSHGLHVYCEKPLGANLSDAREIAKIARKVGSFTHTAFIFRYLPAVRQSKSIIDAGLIGEVFNFRSHYFHSSYINPNRPISWRLKKASSGGGTLTDLGIHLIDLVRYLLGETAWVQCITRTFIGERPPLLGSSKFEIVDVDDWALCTLGMQNNAVGIIEVTRMAGGTPDSLKLEIFGSQGTIEINLADPGLVKYFDEKKQQWRIGDLGLSTPKDEHPIEQLWPNSKMALGLFINAHLASVYDFLKYINEGKDSSINFQTALADQEILEAAYISASRKGERIKLPLL